jgi:large subunit ribosomal protein L16
MLLPKRVKYRKYQRGKLRGKAFNGSTVSFGEFGIKALGSGYVRNTIIETCRVIITRRLRRGGKLWIRIFPDKSVTKKPAETRMGKGKGELDGWVAPIRPGRVLFELGGLPEDYARETFRLIAYKLPFKTMFVTRSR